MVFDEIKKSYDHLTSQEIRSPLTQAAYIAPLNFMNFKPWSYEGFTLSSWLRINPNQTPRTDIFDAALNLNGNSDENRTTDPDLCSPHCFYRNKVHLLSVGTSSLLLSIYICITDVNTLYFQLTNPSAQPPKNMTKSNSDFFRNADGTLKSKTKPRCMCSLMKRRRGVRNGDVNNMEVKDGKKRNRRTVTIDNDANGCAQASCSATNPSSNVFSQTINNTKLALKSSLSHFNLFSSGRNNDLDTDFNLMGYPLELKGVKLYKNKWMLFSMTTSFTGTDIQLQVKIDNSQTFVVNLPCSHSQINSKYEKFKVICIGSKVEVPAETISDTTSSDDSFNTSINTIAEKQAFKYSLSNVLLFRKGMNDKEILANLYALGPDCVNFTQCQVCNEYTVHN